MLTRVSLAPLAALVVAAAAVGVWRHRTGRWRAAASLGTGALVGLGVTLASGWFYLRNLDLYGRLTAPEAPPEFARPSPGSLVEVLTDAHFHEGIWSGLYGSINAPLMYVHALWLLEALGAVLVVGLVLAGARGVSRRRLEAARPGRRGRLGRWHRRHRMGAGRLRRRGDPRRHGAVLQPGRSSVPSLPVPGGPGRVGAAGPGDQRAPVPQAGPRHRRRRARGRAPHAGGPPARAARHHGVGAPVRPLGRRPVRVEGGSRAGGRRRRRLRGRRVAAGRGSRAADGRCRRIARPRPRSLRERVTRRPRPTAPRSRPARRGPSPRRPADAGPRPVAGLP